MRDGVVRRKRRRGSRLVRVLLLGVILLAGWVLSANTILQPYLAPPAQVAGRDATPENTGTLARAPTALPMLTGSAMPQLAAATQPATAEPTVRDTAGTLAAPAEATGSPVVTAPLRLASADDTNAPVLTAPVNPTRLASAAPTVGGADISDAAVIAKAVEPPTRMPATTPATETAAPIAVAPMPRKRPRIAAIPLPRARPGSTQATPVSFLGRLFGVR